MRLHEIRQQISNFRAADHKLRKHGFQLLGSGAFAYVYYHPRLNYVLKLFEKDSCYRDFYEVAMKNPNPHFPKFRGKMMQIVRDVYAVRMERLTAMPYNNITSNLMNYIDDQIRGGKHIKPTDHYQEIYPELKAALDAIRTVTKWGWGDCNLDIKLPNIMMRGDIPVLTDPLWGEDFIDASS